MKTIENEYRNFLCELRRLQLTANTLKEDQLYNLAAEKTFKFVLWALCTKRNRSLISATGFETEMFASDITMHLLDKLDYILVCDLSGMIQLIQKMVNNAVITGTRKWTSIYPTKPGTAEGDPMPMFNFLDDVAWSLLADDFDIENDLIHKEEKNEAHTEVLRVLPHLSCCSRFEVLSLLATKVLTGSDNRPIKTRKLAELLDKHGLMVVSKAFFETAMETFDTTTGFTTFTNDDLPPYETIEELCAKISKASHHAATKLCKKMGVDRKTKKKNK